MDFESYRNFVRSRKSPLKVGFVYINSSYSRHFDPNLQHAIEGLVTESAEMLDVLKKWKAYEKKIDKVNLKEEIGDIMFYVAMAMDALGVEDMQSILDANVAKLSARYPQGFSEQSANVRDLENERSILENHFGEHHAIHGHSDND